MMMMMIMKEEEEEKEKAKEEDIDKKSYLVSECPSIARAVNRQRLDGMAKAIEWDVCRKDKC